MEQRTFHGNVTPDMLADYLVQYYEPQHDLQAQRFGQGPSLMVQIGRGDTADELHHAVTLGITQDTKDPMAITVTMGQQQWITPQIAGYAAMMGLVSIMVTPWALFALIWPVSNMLTGTMLPRDIWQKIEVYMATGGAVTGATQKLVHPHAQQDATQS